MADKVIRYSFSFSAKMDEAATAGEVITAGVDEQTDLNQTLQSFFYPTLGILRGLIKSGFSEEDAEEIVSSMLEFAPAGLSRRSPS